LASHFDNGIHVHFNNAGHLVMAERAEEVNSAIANWLKDSTGSTTPTTVLSTAG
jgi:pimeloyl-ACP methyl ester carboxylesterase